MSTLPGVSIDRRGSKDNILKSPKVKQADPKFPDGSYFYLVTVRARNKSIARGKARFSIRGEYPSVVSVQSFNVFSVSKTGGNNSVKAYDMLIGVNPRL